jgi:ribosomal protein S1
MAKKQTAKAKATASKLTITKTVKKEAGKEKVTKVAQVEKVAQVAKVEKVSKVKEIKTTENKTTGNSEMTNKNTDNKTVKAKVVKALEVQKVEKVKIAKSKNTGKSESKSEKPATSMEELLKQTGYVLKAPQPGQVMKGMVTDVSKKMVLVDIGAKTEGMIVDKEYEAARDFIRDLKIGDEVSVYVLSPENERGQILLSLKRALIDRKWEQFAEYLETGGVVEVKGLEVNKGGMIVVAETVRGFVPSSQFGKEYLGRMEELLGKSFKVKVIEVDKEKNRLIFSERHVSEAEAIAKKAEALKFVKAGDSYEGVVSGIMPFGAFVGVEVPIKDLQGKGDTEVGKVEGLVHISEISWEKVNDPNDYFKLGDRVKVRVLGVDEAVGKLNLSVKQLSDDPWSLAPKKYPVGAKCKGKVSRTAPFGAFVTLEPGVDGLIHISKIPAGNEPQVNDEIDVYVESVDPEQRRMSLGMVLTEVPVGYK